MSEIRNPYDNRSESTARNNREVWRENNLGGGHNPENDASVAPKYAQSPRFSEWTDYLLLSDEDLKDYLTWTYNEANKYKSKNDDSKARRFYTLANQIAAEIDNRSKRKGR